ncbi:translesion DNA synthesis-associated protein ImuA [Aurantivibrio infirmus]
MNPKLTEILQLPSVWQASQVCRTRSVISTGYEALDAILHDGGWPDNATTELLLPKIGIGEFRLLLPGLRRVLQQRPWLVFIAPPYIPYGPALAQGGIDPDAVLILEPKNTKDLLWCAEQTLQSGCCGAVLTWANKLTLNSRQLRRLQQAAHRGQCWHTLYRNRSVKREASPSSLRLELDCSQLGLAVSILKQRGGWSGQQLELTLTPDLTSLQQYSPEQLALPSQVLMHFSEKHSRSGSPNKNNIAKKASVTTLRGLS